MSINIQCLPPIPVPQSSRVSQLASHRIYHLSSTSALNSLDRSVSIHPAPPLVFNFTKGYSQRPPAAPLHEPSELSDAFGAMRCASVPRLGHCPAPPAAPPRPEKFFGTVCTPSKEISRMYPPVCELSRFLLLLVSAAPVDVSKVSRDDPIG